jgi:hypothetical protein
MELLTENYLHLKKKTTGLTIASYPTQFTRLTPNILPSVIPVAIFTSLQREMWEVCVTTKWNIGEEKVYSLSILDLGTDSNYEYVMIIYYNCSCFCHPK